jgi:hypothetical protein
MIRLALGLALIAVSPARAERRPFSLDQVDRAQESSVRAGDGVAYYGGPVIGHVKVNLVFWGPGVAQETQAQLEAFYRGIVNSTYVDQLAEYATNVRASDGRQGTNQTIGRGSFAGATTITPVNKSSSLTQADLEAELEAQIASGALPKPDADSYYALHFPDGYRVTISFGESCSSWYADHEVYRSKNLGNVYYAMFPCGSGDSSNFSMLTFASSHELAEAVSDPMCPLSGQPSAFPAGWVRGDGEEIGDLCTGSRSTFSDGNASYTVNPLWLNSQGGCSTGDFSPKFRRPKTRDASAGAALAELKTAANL